MNRKALILTSMATLMLGASTAGAFAQQPPGPPMRGGSERMFVRLLQQFDTDKNGQISKEEAKAGGDALFAEIDADKDGSLTPGELRKHREAKMDEWRKARAASAQADDDDEDDDDGSDDAADEQRAEGAPPPPPPQDEARADDNGRPDRDRRDGWHGRHDGKHADRGWRHGMREDGRGPGKGWGGKGNHAMERMIHRVDTDENGQISKEEATAMMDKMFTRFDRNGDGVISVDDMPKRPFFFR